MGRYRKYKSDKELRRMVETYFASISRERIVTELVNTGRKDAWGHWEYELRPVTNDAGVYMRERVYDIPPTVGGLCAFLNISRDTWNRYCDRERYPQFAETTEWAREQLLAWREQQLLVRGGKQIRGLLFDLQANYGLSEKRTVELGPKAAQAAAAGAAAMPLQEREALLKEIAREFSEGGDSEAGE